MPGRFKLIKKETRNDLFALVCYLSTITIMKRQIITTTPLEEKLEEEIVHLNKCNDILKEHLDFLRDEISEKDRRIAELEDLLIKQQQMHIQQFFTINKN